MPREMCALMLIGCLGCNVALALQSDRSEPPLVTGEPDARPLAGPAFFAAPYISAESVASPYSALVPGSPTDERWTVGAEYLVWWLREARLPPILTTSGAASQGMLGKADTRVIYGGNRLRTRHDDRFVGTRLTVGYWLDDEHTLGVEAGAFFLERDSTYFKATSNGSILLARPYVNALDGTPASEVIAGPGPAGTLNGGFNGYSRVELFGEKINATVGLANTPELRVDLLAGARFLQMRDRTDLTATGRLLPDQTTLFGLTDHYRADDRFYGGQLGLRAEVARGRWTLSMRGEAALGADDQELRMFGDRTFATPLQHVVQHFGLGVQPGNTGTFHRADLDMVSEAGVNAGYQLTSHIRLFAGYTFLAWLNPIRSGDQVDLTISPSRLAGPARPAIPFREDFFWAQGVNVGLDVRW